MEVKRTPDSQFQNLADFNFTANYVQLKDGLRMHYLDEGSGPPVLMLHGEPTWSYLYRKIIPSLARTRRTIAPDLIGFGKSDKPAEQSAYSYKMHIQWLSELIFDKLKLNNIVLFCQDWGGLIGLRLVSDCPERFSGVIAANTGLPTGDEAVSEAFLAWQSFSQNAKELPVGKIVAGGCVQKIPPEVIAAYDAPFPDESFKAGARVFPLLVSTSPNDPETLNNRFAWEVLKKFDKPFMCAFSDSDPITRGADRKFVQLIPGAKPIEHVTVGNAGHFLQEDQPEIISNVISNFIETYVTA